MKKQILLPLIAVITIIGIVLAGSAFTTEKQSEETTPTFFRFKGNAESSAQLIDPAKWEAVAGNDAMLCPGGSIICTAKIDPLPSYGAPYTSQEERFAHYLDLQTDDGVTFVNTSGNIVSEKN